MKHKVVKHFVCKESGGVYPLGSFYICDDYDRVMELVNLGFIVATDLDKLKHKKQNTRNKKKVSEVDAGKGEKITQDNQ